MKDPTRLLDADGTEFERLLLRAAAEERPSPLLSDRMLAGAATAGAVVAFLSNAPAVGEGAVSGSALSPSALSATALSSTGGSIAPPAAAGLLGAWVIKWGVLGTLLAALGVSGWLALGSTDKAVVRPRSVSTEPAPMAALLPLPTPAAAEAPAPGIGEGGADRPEPEAAVAPRATRAVKPALGPEIDLLDSARRALAAGDAERALGLISSYRRRFPSGALGQEATVLEMDALAAKGRTGQASDLKQQFLAEHPESAHAPRVQRSGSTR